MQIGNMYHNVGDFIFCSIIITGLYVFLFLLFLRLCQNKRSLIYLGIGFVVSYISYLFGWIYPFILVTVIIGAIVCEFLIANFASLKKFVQHPFKGNNYIESNKGVMKIFDTESFYKVISDAVIGFSNSQTGALITFERDNSLQKYIDENGVRINAPVSKELLETIFYEGTRLHDGGVIIKDNIIEAAAVMFPSDSSYHDQKYGARHRAAMGISAATDSITVVVSEETGRISIAIGGELQTVTQASFKTVFENLMNDEKE